MPTHSRTDAAVRFRGYPGRLAAAVPIADEAIPQSLTVMIRLSEGGAALPFQAFAHGAQPHGILWLRLSLPPGTPPGPYEGNLNLGRQELPVLIQVEGRTHFRLTPTSLVLRGEPGETLAAEVTIANDGNVPLQLRKVTAFGVFEVNGVDRALGQTFRAQLGPDERRLDRFLEELAKRHGGLVRAVLSKAVNLKPGTALDLKVNFRLPTRLLAGKTYEGSWPLYPRRLVVRIEVPGAAEEED